MTAADRIEPAIQVADLAEPRDAAAVVDVLDTYAADPVGGGEPLALDVRERLVPTLAAHDHSLVLLARAADQPVGLAICFFGVSTFAAQPLLNIHDLAVVPEARGRGVGRALLTAAERIARERGCCKLTLEVQDDNAPARTLYERFGFTDFVLGEPVPTRFLSKALDPD